MYRAIFLFPVILMFSSITYSQPFSNSVYLDGVNDYLSTPDNINLNQSSTISIEAWINPCKVSSDNVMLSKWWCSGSQNAYLLYVRDGKLRWGWDIDGCGNGASVYESNLPIIQSGIWQHVAAVHSTSGVTLYHNGIPISGSLTSGSFGAIQTSNEPLRIGGYKELNGLVSRKFIGQIDELRIWNYNLNSTEILSRYNNPLGGNETGLVAYYDMDIIGTGTGVNVPNLASITGNILDGTSIGTGSSPEFSNLSNACSSNPCLNDFSLEFDGVDDYVSIPDDPSFDFGTGNFSIGAWFYSLSPGIDAGIIDHIDGTVDSRWTFRKFIDGKLRLVLRDNSNNLLLATSNTSISDSVWYNVAVTFNYATQQVKFYIDGLLQSSTQSGTLTDVINPQGIIQIGKYGYVSSYTKGSIDELHVWNLELDSNQIEHFMCNRPNGSEPGLVAFWNFDEGIGATLTDQSSNNHNGTILGANWDSNVPTNCCCTQNLVNTQPVDTMVSVGANTQFSTTSAIVGVTYQWQADVGFGFVNLSNAGQYSGTDTETLIIINVTLAQNNAHFRCILSEFSTCIDTTNEAILTVSTATSTDELFAKVISVFPIPATSSVSVFFGNEIYKPINFRIYNSLGQIEIENNIKSLKSNIFRLDISSLNSGFHQLLITIGSKRYYFKLVKE